MQHPFTYLLPTPSQFTASFSLIIVVMYTYKYNLLGLFSIAYMYIISVLTI